jgi:hypothetical protein
MSVSLYPFAEVRPADWKDKALQATIFLAVGTIFSIVFKIQPDKNITVPLLGWHLEGALDVLAATGVILFPTAIILLWLSAWSGTQRVTVEGAVLKVENKFIFLNYTKEFEWQQVQHLVINARHAPMNKFSDGNHIQLSFDYGRDSYDVLTGIDYAVANEFLAEIQRQFPRIS